MSGTEVFEYALIRVVPRPERGEAINAGVIVACTEGPLAREPLGQRFRWLTSPRSTIVQPGPVHSGLTADPEAELSHLFDTMVRT